MEQTEIIMKFIREELARDRIRETVDIRSNLIESGIIDSLGIQKLLAFIESRFSIHIADDELIPENFESVESIDSFIKGKNISTSSNSRG